MRNFINIINESQLAENAEVECETIDEQQIDEKLVFDGRDAALHNAFMALCDALNIHESGYNSLTRYLERDGTYSRSIDPRSPINKVTPQQWASLNQKIAPYLSVSFDAPTFTVTALK